MTSIFFNYCTNTLISKRSEYSYMVDYFYNFNVQLSMGVIYNCTILH